MATTIDSKIKNADLALKDLQLIKDDTEIRNRSIEINLDKIYCLTRLLESNQMDPTQVQLPGSEMRFKATLNTEEQSVVKKKIFDIIKKL